MTRDQIIVAGEKLKGSLLAFAEQWPIDEEGCGICPAESRTSLEDYVTKVRKWVNSTIRITQGTLYDEGNKELLARLLRGVTQGIGDGYYSKKDINVDSLFDHVFFMLSALPDEPEAGGAFSGSAMNTIPGTAFILMSMDPTNPGLDDVVEGVREVFREFKIKATRADEIEHQDVITDVVLNGIRSSEFLLADLTGERPNVYYEVGFAHAMGKRPILYRKEGTPLHFDLAGHNVRTYKNVTDLKALLRKRLAAMTGKGAE
jgi:hypothetical protein